MVTGGAQVPLLLHLRQDYGGQAKRATRDVPALLSKRSQPDAGPAGVLSHDHGTNRMRRRYDQKLWTEGLGRKPKEQGLGSFLSDSVDKADAFD